MERVLVIDEDEVLRDSLKLTLEWAGYDVSGAANSREGLAFLQEYPTSVVVADDITTDEDGLDHIRVLRSHSPTLPIIAISGTIPSGCPESDGLNKVLRSVYHLQKPFTVDEFLTTVQTAIPN